MKPPNLLLALSDAPRALTDAIFLKIATPLLRKLPPAQRAESEMVMPGLLGDDGGNRPLIEFLQYLGHTAVGWGQGRNMGTQSFDEEGLRQSMASLIAAGNG